MLIVAICSLAMPAISQVHAPIPHLKPELSSLEYFAGEWECSGKFDSSGKVIDAHQSFTPDLDGGWMLFRHDDKPPFNYHALAEWGWDSKQKKFVMSVEDSGGGLRLFYSPGWESTQLQWDGDAVGVADPIQRFTFERIDAAHFKVSFFMRKGNAPAQAAWSRVDASTCSKR